MALSKEQKQQVVAEVSSLLSNSKMLVMASYSGTSVKDMQQLRRQAKEEGTQVRVIKNRLFKKALESSDKLKGIDNSLVEGQLLYAFNSDDEVAPAKILAELKKINPSVELVGGISQDGQLLSQTDVQQLASLPTKEQLRAQVIGMLNAPAQGFVSILSGNIRGILNVLTAHAEEIN